MIDTMIGGILILCLITGEAAAVRDTAAYLTHIEDYSVKSTNSNILKPRLNETCNVSSFVIILTPSVLFIHYQKSQYC